MEKVTAFEARVRVVSGILNLSFKMGDNKGEFGRYVLALPSNGGSLHRTVGSEWVHFGGLENNQRFDNWRTVRLEMRGCVIRVAVDGVTLLEATDPQPLSATEFGFNVGAGGEVLVDTVRVEGPPPGASSPAPCPPSSAGVFPSTQPEIVPPMSTQALPHARIELSVSPPRSGAGQTLSVVARITPASSGEEVEVTLDGPEPAAARLVTTNGFAFTTFSPASPGQYKVAASWSPRDAKSPLRMETGVTVVQTTDAFAPVPGPALEEPLVVDEGQELVVDGLRRILAAGIVIRGKLVLKDSELRILGPGGAPVNIVLEDGVLEMHNSRILCSWGCSWLFLQGSSVLHAVNSEIDMGIAVRGQSLLRLVNSGVAFKEFVDGGINYSDAGAIIALTDSRLANLTLTISQWSDAELSGLGPGLVEYWSSAEHIRGGRTQVLLERVTLLENKEAGEGKPAFSREWNVRVIEGAKLRISDSRLSVFQIFLSGGEWTFRDIKPEVPLNLRYGSIELVNTLFVGQFALDIKGGARVSVLDSNNFWIFIYDQSELYMRNSVMTEFDPRNFRGSITFDNSTWHEVGEVFDDNDFVWRGATKSKDLCLWDPSNAAPCGVQWSRSRMTREYEVVVLKDGSAVPGQALTLTGEQGEIWRGTTDAAGKASFEIVYNDGNRFSKYQLRAPGLGVEQEVAIFTDSPVILQRGR